MVPDVHAEPEIIRSAVIANTEPGTEIQIPIEDLEAGHGERDTGGCLYHLDLVMKVLPLMVAKRLDQNKLWGFRLR